MGYVQIEGLTWELDMDNDHAIVFREGVPCGTSMRVEFVADAPIGFLHQEHPPPTEAHWALPEVLVLSLRHR